jgi:hypothetical protein
MRANFRTLARYATYAAWWLTFVGVVALLVVDQVARTR